MLMNKNKADEKKCVHCIEISSNFYSGNKHKEKKNINRTRLIRELN